MFLISFVHFSVYFRLLWNYKVPCIFYYDSTLTLHLLRIIIIISLLVTKKNSCPMIVIALLSFISCLLGYYIPSMALAANV
jgi:hypothetical protein